MADYDLVAGVLLVAVVVAFGVIAAAKAVCTRKPHTPRRGRHRAPAASVVPGPTSSLHDNGRWSA